MVGRLWHSIGRRLPSTCLTFCWLFLGLTRTPRWCECVCVCVVDGYLCLFLVLFSTVFREIERSESLILRFSRALTPSLD